MSRSLVTVTLEDHPHCKLLSGQDNLGNFVTRTRLSMSICTTPTNDFKKNTLSLNNCQPCRAQHRNDDHHEDNPAGQNKMKHKLWWELSPLLCHFQKG